MRKKYNFIEHTADVGIKAKGKTFRELFENICLGMLELIIDDFSRVAAQKKIIVKTTGNDYESLLINFLNEIVYLISVKKIIFSKVKIDKLGKFYLTATLSGEKIQPDRHKLNLEIKAATYHNLKIVRTPTGKYKTQVIFDV